MKKEEKRGGGQGAKLALVVGAVALLASACGGGARAAEGAPAITSTPAGAKLVAPSPAPPPTGRHPITIHRAYNTLGMITGEADVRGKPLRVACTTCHTDLPVKAENRRANKLTGFHTGVTLSHGGQSCGTCHAATPRDQFNLADGTLVPYADVMKLCAQCHASRYADYQRGAHGGRSGYWDQTRGPALKNHCLDCHNAHSPAIPKVIPAPRIRYRGTQASAAGHDAAAKESHR